jgi:hypothetical protein
MGEMRNVYKVLVGKPERKRLLGRSRHRFKLRSSGMCCHVILLKVTNVLKTLLHPSSPFRILQNVGILPQHYMVSQPRRPQLESSHCHENLKS